MCILGDTIIFSWDILFMFIIRQIVLNVKIFFSSVKLLIDQIFC